MRILVIVGLAAIIIISFGTAPVCSEPPSGLTGDYLDSNTAPVEPPSQTDDWPVMDSLQITVSNPCGLTWDGEYFWVSNRTASSSANIHQIDPETGVSNNIISAPCYWPDGLTWDGEYLWCRDFISGYNVYPVSSSLCKINAQSGQIMDTLLCRYTYYSGGVAWDGEYLYYGRKTASTPPCPCFIYKLNPVTGAHLDSIEVTTGDIYGLTYLNDHLFYSDAYTDIIYKIDFEGNIVDQSPTPGTNPKGLTIAMNELWNVESGNTTLYCLDIDVSALSITLTPLNPPIQIPSGGGSFTFDLLIDNPTANPVIFDGWTLVMMPGGLPYPLITRPDINLAPGGSISRTLIQYVPAAAIPGEYEYVGNVGEHPDVIWDSDSFPFEKLLDDGGNFGNFNYGWKCYGWDEIESASTAVPEDYNVLTAYPNPFNPETNLRFALSESGDVHLAIFDVTGRECALITQGFYPAGNYDFNFIADNLTTGIYFAKLIAGSSVSSMKLLLLK